jgi:hypothetical protein
MQTLSYIITYYSIICKKLTLETLARSLTHDLQVCQNIVVATMHQCEPLMVCNKKLSSWPRPTSNFVKFFSTKTTFFHFMHQNVPDQHVLLLEGIESVFFFLWPSQDMIELDHKPLCRRVFWLRNFSRSICANCLHVWQSLKSAKCTWIRQVIISNCICKSWINFSSICMYVIVHIPRYTCRGWRWWKFNLDTYIVY